MKILVACERADTEGGTESYLATVLAALVARGHQVQVIARSVAQPDVYGVAATALHWSDEHDAPSQAAAAHASRIARTFAPDVAAVHNVLDAAVLGALRDAVPRVAFHLHDHRPFCPNGDRMYPQGGGICGVAMGATACGWHSLINGCVYGPRPRTLTLTRRRQRVARAVRQCDATIALSSYMAELAKHNGVPVSRLCVVRPPLPPDAFSRTPVARPVVDAVLFAGRVVPSKGARRLVDALAQIAPAQRPELRIAGEGPDLDATIKHARTKTVNVRALGRLDGAALRTACDEATIVAVPSQWGEPFGLIGIEALARGRPVAACNVGAISEWLPTDAGRLVPRGDDRALAMAILQLLARDAWTLASSAALRAARAYKLDAHVALLESIYAGRPL